MKGKGRRGREREKKWVSCMLVREKEKVKDEINNIERVKI